MTASSPRVPRGKVELKHSITTLTAQGQFATAVAVLESQLDRAVASLADHSGAASLANSARRSTAPPWCRLSGLCGVCILQQQVVKATRPRAGEATCSARAASTVRRHSNRGSRGTTRCPTSSSTASWTLPGMPRHRARDAHRHRTCVSKRLQGLVGRSSDTPTAMGRTARGELEWRKGTTQQEKEAAVLRKWMQESLESLAHECTAPIPAEDKRMLDQSSHLYHVVHSTLAAKIGRTNPAHGQLLTDLWRR